MDRSQFIKQFSLLSGGLIASNHLNWPKEEAREDNPNLETDIAYYEGVNGFMKCFTARPANGEKLPGLILIHGDKGLNQHTIAIAKKAASEGFHVLAPDALSTVGGTLGELDENRNAIKKLDKAQNLENFRRGIKFLKSQALTTDKVGVMGFSWGGSLANRLAISAQNLSAVVSYYGETPVENVARINVPILLHYAEQDEPVNKGIEQFESALKDNGKEYRLKTYAGTKHGFNNDTLKGKYDKTAAEQAWNLSIAFLEKYLAS